MLEEWLVYGSTRALEVGIVMHIPCNLTLGVEVAGSGAQSHLQLHCESKALETMSQKKTRALG